MKKKTSLNNSSFEDYRLLAIVSTLQDYTLAYFINKQLGLGLKKFSDIRVTEKGGAFSWYYYKQDDKYMSCYLIGNNHPKQKLLPALKDFDYFFLIKDVIDEEQLQLMASGIRNINNVLGVFKKEIATVSGVDAIIESNEFHEMDQILSPAKKVKNKN